MEPHDTQAEFFEEGVLAYRAALYLYRGRVAEAVQALKYSRRTALAHWMAEQMATAPERFGLSFDAAVAVPIHWSRRASRGFNQSELLASELAPLQGALMRVRRTPPQVGLSREQRQTNLIGAFSATDAVRGLRVMLVDDVLTSGSTARECARALLSAGAAEVGMLTFAGEPFN